jgi:hypothetical protein
MFPHPCGQELAALVQAGWDPRTIVPNGYFVVLGGTKPVPPMGTVFSATVGPTLEAAACSVPYNQIRSATAAAIRAAGGSVDWLVESSRRGTINEQHVHVTEIGGSAFTEPFPNPVAKKQRIDEGQ